MLRRNLIRAGASCLAGIGNLGLLQEALALGAAAGFSTTAPELAPLQGFSGAEAFDARDLRIEGRLPAGLRGVYYRNGPGLMARGGERYQHWFDGDGLVQAWTFGDDGVRHKARFVQTKKFRAEAKAGRFLLPAFGTSFPDQDKRLPVRSADDVNVANTSVMKMGDGRLYALWEGGSAYELDPQNLATKGVRAWSDDLAGMPFSAHPKVEADGMVWNFGTQSGQMVLYQISAQGRVLRSEVFPMPGPNVNGAAIGAAMVHDFAVSQRYLVFLLAPIGLDMQALRGGDSMLGSMRWLGADPTRVLVVDKADFTRRWVLEMPAAMVFHFGNAWDDGAQIRLDYVEAPPLPVVNERLRQIMVGERSEPQHSTPRFMRITLGSRTGTGAGLSQGRIDVQTRDEAVEFPVVDPRVVAQAYRHVYYPTAIDTGLRSGFNGLMHLDIESGRRERFCFGNEVVLEEHVLVPKPGSRKEGEGWLLGLGYDSKARRSFASVFDAQAVSAGPLARVWLPYWVPYGFHGKFYSA
ncbi:carotenoid oxygenase family protein [Roseateles oligotrophus]|uniref:Carotenoid oxygenase family protein n=1 Tax=Roseateles oligotrophus TaxID=1769250 RepID=A0ABT2YA30_9BURK|nr:carotenoid oxygenase family protein [Roseateles oligotrophus]MCV2367153.1 carotenoid oxygenase family protein [Roseateles oligotrophus]